MDVQSRTPVEDLARAYCLIEHGGHASGPVCEFGVKKARRLMAQLPDSFFESPRVAPTDQAVATLQAEAERFAETMGDLYWQSDAVGRANEAISRFELVLMRFRGTPVRVQDAAAERAEAIEDQKASGFVSRRPAAYLQRCGHAPRHTDPWKCTAYTTQEEGP